MKTVRITFEGLVLAGQLLEDRAPKTCQALWESLPLEGPITNDTWGGNMFRLDVSIPEPLEPENVSALQSPGDILFVPGQNGLRFVYGPAQMRGPEGTHPVPRIGRLVGDLTDFVKLAKRVEWEGAKKMALARG
jgi:hypothetical protein